MKDKEKLAPVCKRIPENYVTHAIEKVPTCPGGENEDENTGIIVELVDEILPLLDWRLTIQSRKG